MIAEKMHFHASTTTLVGWLLSGLSRGGFHILGRSFRSRGWASQPSPPWKTGHAVLCVCLMQAHREIPNTEGKLWNELLVVQDQVVQEDAQTTLSI